MTKEFLGPGDSDLSPRSRLQTSAESLLLGHAATGSAGDIRIQAEELQVLDEGLINSETTGPGTGGIIDITTDRLTLSGDARILAVSVVSPDAPGVDVVIPSAGEAGDIMLTARDTFHSDNSVVSTAANQAEGGAITITAGNVQLTNDAVVSAESTGAGRAGSIRVTATDARISTHPQIF